MNINSIKNGMMKKRNKNTAIPNGSWCSSGLTPLNLAASGHPDRGLAAGLCYNYVGDSSAGKTWLAMTNLAEIANDHKFDDYELVYEPAENGANMNVRKFFGSKLASRIRTLRGTWTDPKPVRYLEDFYLHLKRLHEEGKPYAVVIDSMDVLVPRADEKHEAKTNKAHEDGKEAKGSYGTDKARINSAKLRTATNRLKENNSFLFLISQTRHNIGFGAQFNPKTMAGGDAIKFYTHGYQLWLSVVGTESEKIGNEKVKVGQFVRAKITKNHLSGWEGTITFPLFKGAGIDDLGACVDYLVNYGHWTRDGKNRSPMVGKINAREWEVKKRREDLISYIVTMEKEDELKDLVSQVWKEVEEKTSLKRRSRYE